MTRAPALGRVRAGSPSPAQRESGRLGFQSLSPRCELKGFAATFPAHRPTTLGRLCAKVVEICCLETRPFIVSVPCCCPFLSRSGFRTTILFPARHGLLELPRSADPAGAQVVLSLCIVRRSRVAAFARSALRPHDKPCLCKGCVIVPFGVSALVHTPFSVPSPPPGAVGCCGLKSTRWTPSALRP